MRLIDADKLRHELIMGHDLIGAKYTDMADTVGAIPIEWLDKKYEENLTIWKTADTVEESFKASDVTMAIELITELWEKENGRSN